MDLLAFPEMVLPGYPPEDLLLRPAFIQRVIERTRDLLPHTRGLTVVVGTLERDFDLYNAAAVLHDGQWVGTYRKRYLPNYGVFDENRYFTAERADARVPPRRDHVRRQHLRGHLGRRRPGRGAGGARRRRGDRQPLGLALSRAARPASAGA